MPILAAQPPALVAQAVPPRPAPPADVMTTDKRLLGRVTDAKTGKPLVGALVQQVDAVAVGFTGKDGHYALTIDSLGADAVLVSAPGYMSRRVAYAPGRRLDVALTRQASYTPTRAASPPPMLPASAAETAPFNSGIRFLYALRSQTQSQNGTSVAGNVSNEFALGGRLRLRPWLAEAELGHYQSHVDLPNVASAQNPAFKPSTWQAGLRGGYFVALRPELEVALLAGYRYRNVAPNNNGIPYTGTGLDATQTQHAFGPVAAVAWKPGGRQVVLEGSLGYYPLVFAHADNGTPPLAGSNALDARALAAYEIVPGLRAGLGYQYEAWRGTGSDVSSVYSIQIQYTPGGMPKGNEP